MPDMDQDRVLVNLVSWSSHRALIDGDRWKGLTAIDFEDKLETAYGYGMNRSHAPIGRTAGKYTPPSVKTTWHRHSWAALLASLAAKSKDGKSYGTVEFHFQLQLSEGALFSEHEFLRCRVSVRSGKAEENPDPNLVDIEFTTMGHVEDGKTLYDSSEEVGSQ